MCKRSDRELRLSVACSGSINAAELREVAGEIGVRLTEQEVKFMVCAPLWLSGALTAH